jgi:NAD-dependent DNA ligase
MHTNTYLYIIIASLLVGGAAGFLAKEQYELNVKAIANNEVIEQEIQKLKETIAKDTKDLTNLRHDRKNIQLEVDAEAKQINEILKNIAQLKDLKLLYDASIEKAKNDQGHSQSILAEIQDEMQENIALIERSLNQVNENFATNMDELGARSDLLDKNNQKEAIRHNREINKLKKEKIQKENELKRANDLTPIKVIEPWTVSSILDYSPESNKVIIGLGYDSGIRKEMRLMIYTETLGSKRKYKGVMIIREVGDFTATGEMIFTKRKEEVPYKGDSVGTLTYKQGGLSFFLAGKFEGKYKNKAKVADYLRRIGNTVYDELNPNVDFLIEGNLADSDVLLATTFGIPVIEEELFSTYLGE